MKLNKFAYLYSKPLWNYTLKMKKKYLEIYLKTWKYHGILSVRKSGNPGSNLTDHKREFIQKGEHPILFPQHEFKELL